MTNEPYFEVGGRYRNRKGWYEVLEIQGEAMKVRYEADWMEEELIMEDQKKIVDDDAMDETIYLGVIIGDFLTRG